MTKHLVGVLGIVFIMGAGCIARDTVTPGPLEPTPMPNGGAVQPDETSPTVPTPTPEDPGQPSEAALCVNRCGNGTCEEMVCQGTGCPCAETVASCPADCR